MKRLDLQYFSIFPGRGYRLTHKFRGIIECYVVSRIDGDPTIIANVKGISQTQHINLGFVSKIIPL